MRAKLRKRVIGSWIVSYVNLTGSAAEAKKMGRQFASPQ
jgi:hypothetical protein